MGTRFIKLRIIRGFLNRLSYVLGLCCFAFFTILLVLFCLISGKTLVLVLFQVRLVDRSDRFSRGLIPALHLFLKRGGTLLVRESQVQPQRDHIVAVSDNGFSQFSTQHAEKIVFTFRTINLFNIVKTITYQNNPGKDIEVFITDRTIKYRGL